jgi:hypothetical protein
LSQFQLAAGLFRSCIPLVPTPDYLTARGLRPVSTIFVAALNYSPIGALRPGHRYLSTTSIRSRPAPVAEFWAGIPYSLFLIHSDQLLFSWVRAGGSESAGPPTRRIRILGGRRQRSGRFSSGFPFGRSPSVASSRSGTGGEPAARWDLIQPRSLVVVRVSLKPPRTALSTISCSALLLRVRHRIEPARSRISMIRGWRAWSSDRRCPNDLSAISHEDQDLTGRHGRQGLEGRARGEYFQYEAGSDGEPNFHGSTGAMPPSDEPVEYWEWEEFRRLERLAGCASPVLCYDTAEAEGPGA